MRKKEGWRRNNEPIKMAGESNDNTVYIQRTQWRGRGRGRSNKTHLLGRQHLPILLVVLADIHHQLLIVRRDGKTALFGDLEP